MSSIRDAALEAIKEQERPAKEQAERERKAAEKRRKDAAEAEEKRRKSLLEDSELTTWITAGTVMPPFTDESWDNARFVLSDHDPQPDGKNDVVWTYKEGPNHDLSLKLVFKLHRQAGRNDLKVTIEQGKLVQKDSGPVEGDPSAARAAWYEWEKTRDIRSLADIGLAIREYDEERKSKRR